MGEGGAECKSRAEDGTTEPSVRVRNYFWVGNAGHRVEFPVPEGARVEPNPSQFRVPKASAKPTVKPAVRPAVKPAVKTPVKILKLLQKNPELTLSQVAAVVGRSQRAVELASSKLAEAGQLRYVGPQRGGHWEVLE